MQQFLRMNSLTTLVKVVCALAGFTFVCGGYHSPWAYGCLDGWCMAGQCLLGSLTVPRTVYQQTKTHHWSTPLNLPCPVRKDLTGVSHDLGFTSLGSALLPWFGVNVHEAMIRNLSSTLENIAESTAKMIAAEPKSLDFLAKVVLGNRKVPDYPLAEQGSVCSVVNTTCCTWINSSGEVETQLQKITKQATWLKTVTPSVGSFFDLLGFDWFGSWGPWLQSALQTLGISLLVTIIITLAHCIFLLSFFFFFF